MKTKAKSIVAVFALSLMLASVALAEKCDRLIRYELPVTNVMLENDLTTGTWLTEIDGVESALYFNEDGLVDIISREYDADAYSHQKWQITSDCGHLTLSLYNAEAGQKTYNVLPTCDGFMLTDRSGNEIPMVKRMDNTRSVVEQMRTQMQGVWESTGPRSRKKNPDMRWKFAENGTFALKIGPDQHHSSYEGVWDVAPDARGIILRFASVSSPEQVYATKVLRVHSLDFEDLVLSGEPMARLSGHDAHDAKYFFEKQF